MGKALADAFAPARAVFEEVDAALGQKLSQIIFEGPAEELTLTANTQPALMAVSLATMRVLEAEAGLDLSSTRASSQGIRWASIPRFAAAERRSRLRIRRGCCAFAATQCRSPCRWAEGAPWRRCSGSN